WLVERKNARVCLYVSINIIVLCQIKGSAWHFYWFWLEYKGMSQKPRLSLVGAFAFYFNPFLIRGLSAIRHNACCFALRSRVVNDAAGASVRKERIGSGYEVSIITK
ncbi:hypothetical protein, partial [Ferruginibacter sp.]|uniref:hypothetical protein n=1 Tax=Ferruginibacter sp. TaxID=1940288 RepID=UPI00374CEF1B